MSILNISNLDTKNNKNNFLVNNNIDMSILKNYFKIKLQKNKKIPAQKWKDRSLWKKNISSSNYAIMTGPENNLSVIDVDYKLTSNDFFYKYLKSTFVVETRKGYHFYFKYTTKLVNGKNSVCKLPGIDTRGMSGYVVGPGSTYKNSKYQIINNMPIIDIPIEIIDYFNNNIIHKQKNTKYNKNMKNIIKTKNTFDYNFMLPNIEKYIRNNLPKKFISNYEHWFKFSSFCRVLNLYDIWDEMSKKSSKYNKSKNNSFWNALDTKFNDIIPFMLKQIKYDKFNIENVKYKPIENLIKDPFIIDYEIHQEKLDFEFVNQIFDTNKCTIIKSDTGTGKSTVISKYINKTNCTYFSLVSRKSLLREQWKKLPNGQVASHIHDGKFRGARNTISTIEKAPKFLCKEVIFHDDFDFSYSFDYVKDCTLILDEYDSFLKHIIFSPTIKDRVKTWDWFVKLIKNVKKVICVDADISEISLYFMKRVLGDITFIKNTYQHNHNVSTCVENNYKKFVHKIKCQNKFMVACDSAKDCQNLKSELEDLGVKDIKMYIADNDNNEQIEMDKYDKIIFSPRIVYGLDSIMERPVFGLYKGHTIESSAMVQQIARNRNITNLTIYFENKKYTEPSYKSVGECRKSLKHTMRYLIEDFGVLDTHCKLYFDIFVLLRYNLDSIGTNKYVHLIKILNDRGCSINFEGFADSSYKENKFETLEQEVERAKKNICLTNESKRLLMEDLGISKEQYMEHIEILRDAKNISYHYNVKSYFLYENLKVNSKNDFVVSYINSNNCKLNLLRKMKEYIIIENNYIKLLKEPKNLLNFNYLIKEVSQIKQKLTKDNYLKIFVKLNKLFFGKQIINSKKKQIKGKREYQYFYNQQYINKHKQLYEYRNIDVIEVDSDSEEYESYIKINST